MERYKCSLLTYLFTIHLRGRAVRYLTHVAVNTVLQLGMSNGN